VDALLKYINTPTFNIDVTSSDGSGSGVDNIELWYRKDHGAGQITNFASLLVGSDFIRYCGGSLTEDLLDVRAIANCNFNPANPISFDTSVTGGDGFYEFYSIAVDSAGNRETVPTDLVKEIAGLIEVNGALGTIKPDTSTTVDTKAPVITLNGVSPITVTQGGGYSDAGATADDGSVVIPTGSVNTAVLGSYVLRYNATDLAGNKAVEVTRTVNVVAAPVSNILAPLIFAAGPATGITEGGPALGAATGQTQNDQNKDVKGAETSNNNNGNGGSNQNVAGMLWGLQWYWWLLILAALGAGWWFFAAGKLRRKVE
jgi:hypothetical protein